MTMTEWLVLACFGTAFGALGQVIRIVMGLLKRRTTVGTPEETPFSSAKLSMSIVYGVSAGILSTIALISAMTDEVATVASMTIDTQFVLSVIAAGYAGADFIESFAKSFVQPLVNRPPLTPPTQP